MTPAPHLREGDSIAFDAAGHRIGITWPPDPDDEPDVPNLRAERAALLRGLLMWLVGDAVNVKSIGQRALLLSHLVNPRMTQRELAKALMLTPGRVSQILSELRTKLNFRA